MISFKLTHPNFFTYILLLVSVFCNGQSTGDYRSNATLMNWDEPANWQTWDASSSSWVTATSIPDANQLLITIQQGHTVTITSTRAVDQIIINGTLKNMSASLTIADGPGDDVSITVGGKLVNEGTNAIIINRGKLIMNDSIINKSTGSFTNNGILVNDHAYFKNAGKFLNEAGSLIINSGDFLTGGFTSFEKGSVYQHLFPSTQPTAGTIPTASWKTGSVCEILSCGNAFQPGALNQVFHHFIWNNSTQPHDFNLIANPNNVNGNFEIKSTNGKKLAYKGGSSGDLAIADSFKLTGGIFVLTNGNASTLVKTNTYYQEAGILDMSMSTAASTLFVASSFTHTGGTLQRSGTALSNEIILNGSTPSTIESIGFHIEDPITFKINKEGTTGSCLLPVSKSFVLNTGTSFILSDNASHLQDLKIDGVFQSETDSWNLTQGNTLVNGNFINRSTLPVRENSSPSSLQFSANSFYTHSGDGGEVVTATWSPSSTLHVTGIENTADLKNGGQSFGTILWSCNNQYTSCIFGSPGFEVKGDFRIESTGNKNIRFPDCDFRIGGDLTVRNDAILQLSSAEGLYTPLERVIIVDGTVSVLQNASLQVGTPNATTTATATTDQQRDYNLQIKKDFIYTSSTPLVSYHHKSYPGKANDELYYLSLTFNGNKEQQLLMKNYSTDLVSLSSSEHIVNNFYKLAVSGTGTLLLPQMHHLKVHEIRIDEDDTLNIAREDINIVLYPTLNFTGTPAPPVCQVNGIINLGLNTLIDGNSSGSFHLNADATLITKHAQGIEQNAATGCILNTGERAFDPAAHYIYNGNSHQITGTGLPLLLAGSLTIDNTTLLTSGGITLSRNTTINGTLYLNNGKLINTPSTTLIIGNTGTVIPAGGRAFSFVDGPIKKTSLLAGNEFIFPTGNKNKWARISITANNSTIGEFTATHISENPTVVSNTLVDLHHISTKEYWKLDKTNHTDAVAVKLFWESGTHSGIYSTNPTDLKIVHANIPVDQKWRSEEDNFIIAGNPTTGSIQSRVTLSDFNLFTFGSITSINPLPIILLSFTGNNTPKGNVLKWSTASEQNSHSFCVQRSSNGHQFSQIGTVASSENSSSILSYSYIDSMPSTNVVYYRLKQLDNDGKYTYSIIIRLENINRDIQDVLVYPNPATADDIHIITPNSIQSFRIYNLLGKTVFEGHPTAETTEHIFTPSASGIYFIKAIAIDGKIITKRLIKN